jgi:uncharacterized membrane protein YoaK (UPF0700 family)
MTSQSIPRLWSTSPTFSRDFLVVLLAGISGYVDAVSYLGLQHVFTANMTGNTVLLGLAIGAGDLPSTLRSGIALIGYIIGVGVAATLVHKHEKGVIWPAEVTRALALECLVLFALSFGGLRLAGIGDESLVLTLIALSAIAMGLQSVAVRPLSVPGITTTYITGTWTSLISDLAVRLHVIRGGGIPDESPPRPSSGARLQAIVLLFYGIAAVGGGAANARWGVASIFLPAVVIGIVALLALLIFPKPNDALDEVGS